MKSEYPFLKIQDPEGKTSTIELKEFIEQQPTQPRITIGRGDDNNIVLPDPHKKVSRQHAAIERGSGRWWLVDTDSANGTFLRQGNGKTEIDVRSEGSVPLKNGNVILILGKWSENETPIFWQLTFRDPNETELIDRFQTPEFIEYHLSQQQLYRATRQTREEIRLRPQERSLIHHMAQRNRTNNDEPIVCNYEELILAIWTEAFGHTTNEVSTLVFGIRDKIERDSGEPQFLKTIRGKGYLLDVKIFN
jgi:DNA-binding winged helix-turn-helix (wHTH) protein